MLHRTVWAISLGSFLVACGSSGPGSASDAAPGVAEAAAPSLPGQYLCDFPDGKQLLSVSCDSILCHSEYAGFWPDGTGSWSDRPITWAFTDTGFVMCEASQPCVECTRLGTQSSPSATSTTKSCQGIESDCSSQYGGSCSMQKGCYLHQHVTPGGNVEEQCQGVAASCDELVTEETCTRQDGCHWS